MNAYEEARDDDDDTDGVELIRPASTFGSFSSGVSTSSKKCDDAKVLSRATTQATLAAKTILSAGGSEDTALRTAQAAAQATLLESHIGISAFSNSKGGPSAYMKRRKIKRQSEVVASMALMSASNQVYNQTDWDLLCGEKTSSVQSIQSMNVGSSKSAKFARPPRSGAPRTKSLPAIIQDEEAIPFNSGSSKVFRMSIDSAKTASNLLPSASKPTKSKSRSIEMNQDMGLAEKAESRSLETAVVSQDSGKDCVAVDSHQSEGKESSSGGARPRLSIVRLPSIASLKPKPVKINVLQSPGINGNGHYGTVDEPVYFLDHGATEAERRDRYDTISVDSSTMVSEADSYIDMDITNSSFLEDDMEPCFAFWRCGAGDETEVETKVETLLAQAVMKKKLRSSRIETPRIVLTDDSTDAETEFKANQDGPVSPYEVALSDEQKQFRAKLRAAAKKREKILSAERKRAKTAEAEVQDDAEREREGSKNEDEDSSKSSCWEAGDLSFESHASSFSKSNPKGQRYWKKLLRMQKKQVSIE